MYETVLKSGWESVLFGIPFIGMLLACFLRLDEFLVAPRQASKPTRPARGIDNNGNAILCDPDGRPWAARPSRR